MDCSRTLALISHPASDRTDESKGKTAVCFSKMMITLERKAASRNQYDRCSSNRLFALKNYAKAQLLSVLSSDVQNRGSCKDSWINSLLNEISSVFRMPPFENPLQLPIMINHPATECIIASEICVSDPSSR